MCGLFIAELNQQQTLEKCKESLLQLARRGPDSFAYLVEDGIFFGQTVLSFTRSSAHNIGEHLSDSGRYLVWLNGEIYNWKHIWKNILRDRLEIKSDIHLLSCLLDDDIELDSVDLMGMYVIIIYDKILKKIKLITDKMGEKSAYYVDDGNGYIISSEIKPIINLRANFNINFSIFGDYFATRHYTPDDLTIWRGVYKTIPSFELNINLKEKKLQKIKKLSLLNLYDRSLSSYYESLRGDELVLEMDRVFKSTSSMFNNIAVKPGAICSGGVDSSLASEYLISKNKNISFFALSFKNKDEQVEEFISETGRAVNVLNVDEGMYFDALHEAYDIAYQPLPTHSFISQILISKFAKQHNIKELYTGDVGDELFGGYSSYLDLNLNDGVSISPSSIYSKMNSSTIKISDESVTQASLNTLWNQISSFARDNKLGEMWAVSVMDLRWNGFNVGLTCSDLATSAQGMEARCFYTSSEILKFAINLPDRSKIKFSGDQGTTRPLQKDLFKHKFGYVPSFKQGFSGYPDVALRELDFGNEFKEFLNEIPGFNLNLELMDSNSAYRWKLLNINNFYRYVC